MQTTQFRNRDFLINFLCLKSAPFLGVMCLIVLQQLLVASMIPFLALLIDSLTSGKVEFFQLVTVLALFFLPYLPATIIKILLPVWQFRIISNYLSKSYELLGKRYKLLGRKHTEQNIQPILAQEIYVVSKDTTHFAYEVVGGGINVVFTMISISLFISYVYSIAYIGAVLSSVVVFTYFRARIKTASAEAQKERIRFGGEMRFAIPTLVTQNEPFFSNQKKQIETILLKGASATKKREFLVSVSSVASMVGSLICVAAATVYLFWTNWSNAAFLAILIVTLPRQVQMLAHLSGVFDIVFAAPKLLKEISNINLTHVVSANLASQVVTEEYDIDISSKAEKFSSSILFDSMRQGTISPNRYTIRGKNGAGKSLFLSEIASCPNNYTIFYLPTGAEMFNSNSGTLSTGETIKSILQTAFEHDQYNFFILDEWDANLDGSIVKVLDQQLNDIAKQSIVMEVRHSA